MTLEQDDVIRICKRVVDHEMDTALVAEQFDVSRRRIQQLAKEYRETGEIPTLEQRGQSPCAEYPPDLKERILALAEKHDQGAEAIPPCAEQLLDGPASLFTQTRKYGIRMANFLPALPLCDRLDLDAEILVDETAGETRRLTLNHTDGLESHYSAGGQFDSDLERTLTDKWNRANTDCALVREDDVFDVGAEVLIPEFAVEHPDGRRAILEIIGFWTPEYLTSKLEKLRQADADNLLVAVSERLECADEDVGAVADRVLWFKTGIHVYVVVELAEANARQPSQADATLE